MFDKQQILDIKQAAGLAAYEKRLPDLKAVGNEYRAPCPFHRDHNPSLAVYQKDGVWLWRCMSHPEKDACGSGDIFELITKQSNGSIKFIDAVKMVATEGGFDVEEQKTPFEYEPEKWATELFRCPPAIQYLKKRGISEQVIEDAGLGLFNFRKLGQCIAIPYANGGVKFRSGNPQNKHDKFRHRPDYPTAHELYGLDSVVGSPDYIFSQEIWITESELDSLTLRSHGVNAVSVSSATTSVDPRTGQLKIRQDQLDKLADAEKIFIATDMDEAGERCAKAFMAVLPPYKTYRIKWDYRKGTGQPKDLGEIYTQGADQFETRLKELRQAALDRPPEWRTLFHSIDEMEEGEIMFLIESILPEGTTFIGGLSGAGKTWFALSMAKALTTGQPFLGQFKVPDPVNVVYLIPESGEKAFRKRCERMGLKDRFLCRTLKDGTLELDDPRLLQAVAALHPVVFLDTAIRFSQAESENDSNANSRGLAAAVGKLRNTGAQAVIGLHHSPKTAASHEMTLENTLRGTGDLGAMCDMVYGVRCLRTEDVELKVRCVKARDCEPCTTFRIKGRPWINKTGDFGQFVEEHKIAQVEREAAQAEREAAHASEAAKVAEVISKNPKATLREIAAELHISVNRIKGLAEKEHWLQENGKWVRVQTAQAPLIQ